MQDLTIVLENVPGSLARLGQALGEAGVNIEGGCAISEPSGTIVHILVADSLKARDVLERASFVVKDEQDAIAFYVSGEDRPGILARYAKKMSDVGINIERMYLAAGSRLAFVTDDNARARAAIRG